MSLTGQLWGDKKKFGVQVNEREDQDGVETAPPTVGDDGTNEGHGIDPECVEGTDSKGFLLTQTKCTGDTIGTVVLWNCAGS